jgi:hypothetical protein
MVLVVERRGGICRGSYSIEASEEISTGMTAWYNWISSMALSGCSMRNIATITLLSLLALALVAVPLAGCTQTDEAAPGQTQDEPSDICPDTLLQGDSIVFSTDIDNDGDPLDIATVFPADTAEIFCTFTLSGDLCCSDVIVMWQHEGVNVLYWNEDGTGLPDTNTVSMARPEGGFVSGEYLVRVFVSIREVINETFTIE